ncbi:MAG: glycosyltransferase [Oscillospiraceae bacterium]|jgi:glycosyltransferase involved in cell wall biosynthesis|nr:glycosyltransferase [Oscillospiraceae bacterium]
MGIDLSIIVPVYNRENIFKLFLNQFNSNNLAGLNCELIILDHGSDFDLNNIIQCVKPLVPCKVIHVPRKGRNCASPKAVGARIAEGEVICFIDCDILLLEGALQAHYYAIKSIPNQVSIGYNYYPTAPLHPWPKAIEEALDAKYIQYDFRQKFFNLSKEKNLSYGWIFCWMGNVALSKSLYEQSGGFDTAYLKWGCEDTDLAYRLSQSGANFYFNDKAAGIHYPHIRPISNSHDYTETSLYLFHKYPVWELELLLTGRRKRIDWYEKFRYELIQKQRKSQSLYSIPFVPDLLIGNGYICDSKMVVSLDINQTPAYQLFGFKLPFADQSIGSAIISDYWRYFVDNDLRDIFYEALRVSRRVFICCCSKPDPESPWLGDINTLSTMLGEHMTLNPISENILEIGFP